MPPITVCAPQRYRVEFHYINVNDCLSNCQPWIVPHSSQGYGLLPYCRLRLPPQSHYMCRSFRPHPLDSINHRPIFRNHSHFQHFVRYRRYMFFSAFQLSLSTVHCFNNDTHPTAGSRTLLFPDIVCSITNYAIVGIFAKMIFRLVFDSPSIRGHLQADNLTENKFASAESSTPLPFVRFVHRQMDSNTSPAPRRSSRSVPLDSCRSYDTTDTLSYIHIFDILLRTCHMSGRLLWFLLTSRTSRTEVGYAAAP